MKSLYGGRLAEELIFRSRLRDDRRVERHRACDRDRAEHGDEMGAFRSTRAADLFRG